MKSIRHDFCRQLGYFDISPGRGEHRSMKYERVPRDFRNGFLTNVHVQL